MFKDAVCKLLMFLCESEKTGSTLKKAKIQQFILTFLYFGKFSSTSLDYSQHKGSVLCVFSGNFFPYLFCFPDSRENIQGVKFGLTRAKNFQDVFYEVFTKIKESL